MPPTWTVLHGGTVGLAGYASLVALAVAVLAALVLRHLGVLDAVGGAFVAGERRED